MHISLLTATGAYNLGDELILQSEYEYLRARYPDATFSVFTYDPKSSLLPSTANIRYISYFPNALKHRPIANIVFFLQNIWHIARSDLVVIGGGGLIYDNESGQSFKKLIFEWLIRIQIARFFHIPILYWSLGIHILPRHREEIRSLFTGNNIHVTVRDSASKQTLDAIGIESTLIADPVLLYDPEIPKLLPKRRPRVGLALRSGYLSDELGTIEQIITFLKANDYEPIILNHSFHPSDPTSNDSCFMASLVKKYRLTSTRTMRETLDAYKELDFVIAMRLHSIILSIVHAIPFFAISYSSKTDELIRSLSHEYHLKAQSFDIEIFRAQFAKLEQDKKGQEFALSEKNDTIKKGTNLTLNTLFDGLEKTRLGRSGMGK